MTLVSILCSVAALALLALSLRRHAGQAGIPSGANLTGLRVGGVLLLALSFAVRLAVAGWPLALIEWIGQLVPSSAAVMLVLTYRPALFARLLVPARRAHVGARVATTTRRAPAR